MDKWKHGGNWHVRNEVGQPVNLNTEAGVLYVLALQAQVRDFQARPARRRRKAGPSETKRGTR